MTSKAFYLLALTLPLTLTLALTLALLGFLGEFHQENKEPGKALPCPSGFFLHLKIQL